MTPRSSSADATAGPAGVWTLTPADLAAWLEALRREGKRLVAPVAEGSLRRFRRVEAAAEVCLEPGKPRWSPKEFLFPRTEVLFAYAAEGDEVSLEDPPLDDAEQVLFGVRPCDAAGLRRLDAVFLGREPDGFYQHRRARTTVVGLACTEAAPECFCTAVGGGPGAEEGSDLLLVPAGEGWLLRPLTSRGAALTAALPTGARPAPPEAWAAARERIDRVAAEIGQRPLAREWAARLEGSFDLPLWTALGRRCLGCSICTYVCPSCSCFDVQDAGNPRCGIRCRSWDSCTFDLFTRHASGHNPRPTQAARYRQRVLHKFAYYPLEHGGAFMCVGCGRCVRLCPVGLDVRETVRRLAAAAGGEPDGGP